MISSLRGLRFYRVVAVALLLGGPNAPGLARSPKDWGCADWRCTPYYVMNEILIFVASVPIFVLDAVAGAVAGFLGGVTGFIAEKYFGLSKGWRFVPAFVFAVISVNLSHWILEDAVPLKIVSQLKESRVGGLIFKYHPEAEREALAQAKKNLSEPDSDSRIALSWRPLIAEIAGPYIRSHMPTASDAAIHRFLQTLADTIELLRNNPTDCVAKYLATSTRSTYVGIGISREELNAIADIIETSVTSPSAPQKNPSIDDFVRALASAYRAKGYDIAELDKIANVQSLPPAEGCEVAYHFASVLASMNEKQSSYLYKALIANELGLQP